MSSSICAEILLSEPMEPIMTDEADSNSHRLTRRTTLGTDTVSRRNLIKLGGAAAAAVLAPGRAFAEAAAPIAPTLAYFGLATSAAGEFAYSAQVEGRLPEGLRGTLYRNGPGLFERDGWRKQHILDGDGMIRAYRIDSSGALFQNRFVRTAKYLEEADAGQFLYSTWASQLPGGPARNAHPNFRGGEAGVSVRSRGDALYAFDESFQPYQLDPATLETVGVSLLGLPTGSSVYSAHPKEDPLTGAWIHFGTQYGSTLGIHLTEFARDGTLVWHRLLQAPRYVYVHDFFVTERYIVLHLHPAFMDVASWQAGQTNLLGCVQWRPQAGGLLLVVERRGNEDPIQIETPPVWMWHALNAYDRDREIVADCVAYDDPDTFVGADSSWRAVMKNQSGIVGAPGAIRRLVIAPHRRRAQMETLDKGNHEFPTINPSHALRRHRYGYFGLSTDGTGFFNAVVRMNMQSGRRQQFAFGPDQYSSEPVFVADPGKAASPQDEGWLLVEVLDGRSQTNHLAVLRADRIEDGPVAKVQLRHALPLSFHGCWVRG
jgi:all-trans-8'-apo-beta-carotenal 15,15'-oxygenase